MTLVSVIIPCYNRARFVGEAIESALAQDHPETEVIVVDDGSTDESWHVISAFGQRVRAVRVENGGAARARNIGLGLARGAQVKFLDSDDLLEPGVIARQAGEIPGLPAGSIPIGTIRWIDEVAAPLAPPRPLPGSPRGAPVPLDRLLRFEGVTIQTPMFPVAGLHTIGGFREDLLLAEDYDLMLRLHLAGYRFFATETRSSVQRIHRGPRLSTPSDARPYAQLADWFESTLAAFDARGSGPLSQAERVAFARLIWSRARAAARSGYTGEARRLFALGSRIGGRQARSGSSVLRALYRIADPVTSERIALAAKRALGY